MHVKRLHLIYKSSTRLQELVDQLLQFRTMENGDLKLNLTEGDIILFIKKISDHFVDYAQEYGITLECNSKLLPYLHGLTRINYIKLFLTYC